jgi:dipeptidase E
MPDDVSKIAIQTLSGIVAPYVQQDLPKLILANRFDYTISNIKYLLPQPIQELKAICIMTAAYGQGEGNYDWVYPQDIDPLKSLGLNIEFYDVADKSEEQVRKDFEDVDLIIMTGGDTYYLLKHLRACNFERLLKEKLDQGITYIASSAGACICAPDIDFIAPMDSPLKAGLDNFTGFNIVPFAIVPHLNHPHLAGAAKICMENCIKKNQQVVGLRDEQFMIVNGSGFQVF